MTKTIDTLLDIERQFWTGDEAFFRKHTDDTCLVAFTNMAKAMEREELAGTATNPNRWRDLEMELKGVVEPSADVALLSYEASATRDNGEAYRALVSTGYVRRPDGWKMMFHAQAPLTDA